MKKNVRVSRLLANFALLAISAFCALLFGELGLRALGFEPMYVSPERDRYWKYDPLLGWAHEPGQEGLFETPQFQTSLRINQQGLRDEEHAYERLDDKRRILVLGDSFAWGYGVEESERFSELLETSLDVEVINAGVSGYSTDQELLWLESEGAKYEVDLVILVFTGNDIGDNKRQLVNTIYYKPRFENIDGRLVLKGSPVARASARDKSIYLLSQRSALAFFLVQRYFELRSLYTGPATNTADIQATESRADKPVTPPFDLTLNLLAEMKRDVDKQAAQFLIVASDGWWNAPPGETYASFIKALERQGFLVLDVTTEPGFDAQLMNIPGDGHWNAAGHEFVAEKVTEVIDSEELLKQPDKE